MVCRYKIVPSLCHQNCADTRCGRFYYVYDYDNKSVPNMLCHACVDIFLATLCHACVDILAILCYAFVDTFGHIIHADIFAMLCHACVDTYGHIVPCLC